jgi:phosphomevalonate kinase
MVLIGEYGVLDGGRALVAAVNARATATRVSGLDLGSPVVREVRKRALALGGSYEGGVAVDTSTFRDGPSRKLGIGSSAATAMCTAALVRGTLDETTFRAALEGHRAAAGGRGSGIDLRAAFHGGVVVCGRQPGPVEQGPTSVPGLVLSVFHLGASAQTSELIGTCRRAPDWDRWVGDLRSVAEDGIDAWVAQDPTGWLNAVTRFARTMDGLGRSAGVDLITDRGRELIAAAAQLGGAAKPSGAGGGDIAVAWTPSEDDAETLSGRVSATRLTLAIDPRGLRWEPQ